ncbi:uncharacterized protein CTRU02_203593 [Colletotrichum truncatum]|uniref:Uncharacterized protein n=1 Tax=Colletotrichum truncatum TaxID=5467 RepID=A0ACC3Z9Z7_COLTU
MLAILPNNAMQSIFPPSVISPSPASHHCRGSRLPAISLLSSPVGHESIMAQQDTARYHESKSKK